MTLRARTALQDCKLALELLEKEEKLDLWRVHWVSALTLCRIVGHVLQKVDAWDHNEKDIIDRYYREWKSDKAEHEIFREFIENHRNALLKEYDFKQHSMIEVPILLSLNLVNLHTGEPKKLEQIASLGENIYRPILDGYREGDDARDVLKEAIDWWEKQLSVIDVELAKHRLKFQNK